MNVDLFLLLLELNLSIVLAKCCRGSLRIFVLLWKYTKGKTEISSEDSRRPELETVVSLVVLSERSFVNVPVMFRKFSFNCLMCGHVSPLKHWTCDFELW